MNYIATKEMSPFQLNIPQFFGIGVSAQVGIKLKELGCTKVLVICDKGIEATGIPAKLINYIAQEGIASILYSGVQADPPDVAIEEVSTLATMEQVDGLVAVGGGSSIDTAKAVCLLSTNEGPINRYFDLTVPRNPGIPLIVLPTTAGTGSEVSAGGVITETATQTKRVFLTAATMALIDPELTVGVPKRVTASCGFDALAHCVDAIFSINAGPLCKLIAFEGVRLFRQSILEVIDNGKNLQARSDMALASNIGGISISVGGANLCHALAHSIGAKFHIPHGEACALLTPVCLEFMAEEKPDEVRTLGEIFGVEEVEGESVAEFGHRIGKAIAELGEQAGIPNLRQYVLSLNDLLSVIPYAMNEKRYVERSPRTADETALKQILTQAFNY